MGKATSIIGVSAIRFSRLTADGTPDFLNGQGAFALCSGISKFEHDFDIQEGKEIYEEDAAGNACVNIKRFNRTKRATGTITLCKRHHAIPEILGVASGILNGDDELIGHGVEAAQGCGAVATPNGVAVEMWSENYDCDELDDEAPYIKSILKRAFFTPKGYVKENGLSLPVYDFFAIPNANYGDGPFGEDEDMVTGTDNMVYVELDADALPTCPDPLDYIPLPSGAS